VLVARRVGVEGLGAIDGYGGELGVEFFEDGFAEAGADIADAFVSVSRCIVAGE
jgi:hypothetical protein